MPSTRGSARQGWPRNDEEIRASSFQFLSIRKFFLNASPPDFKSRFGARRRKVLERRICGGGGIRARHAAENPARAICVGVWISRAMTALGREGRALCQLRNKHSAFGTQRFQ